MTLKSKAKPGNDIEIYDIELEMAQYIAQISPKQATFAYFALKQACFK